MTKEERKAEQLKIWLARVFAHATDNEDEVYKEAIEKFNKEYDE